MKHAQKFVVAMSGGVDSSVAAALLVEQGHEVTGLFMRLGNPAPADTAGNTSNTRGCCSVADAHDARFVAGKLGIPFFALNFAAEFDGIIDYFVSEYIRGRTPNPCVVCNRQLKFGRLLEYARFIGADAVATGHYARIVNHDGRPRLLRALDRDKDQSYVLFELGPDALAKTAFPIGDMTKDQVRRLAAGLGLPVHDKPDSSDICFVPDRDYTNLIRQRRPDALKPGDVRDQAGRLLGRHEGVAGFTIGQRRGLRIALGAPAYVTGLDAATNTVTVGTREQLHRRGLVADRVCWHIDEPAAPIRADVQIRYAHTAAPATIEHMEGGRAKITFDRPQPAIAPGQAAVFYCGDMVIGGGWIERSFDA